MFFAAILGWVSTHRSGTAFAMISLGVAELVASSSLILRTFFGGEAGISANRTKLLQVFDWNFGPQIQIYYLVAFWTLIAVIAMYALTRTPLGRMCNAVRDNPERVQFVGYDPHVIRYLAFCFAGFFAGIAGALAAINFEIANSAYLGAAQSGVVLFATYIGGVGFLHRADRWRDFCHLPLARAERPDLGVAALFRPVFHRGRDVRARRNHRASDDAPPAGPSWDRWSRCCASYLIAFVPTLAMMAGLILAIEIVVQHTVNAGEDPNTKAFGVHFNAASPWIWLLAMALIIGGFIVARRTWTMGRTRPGTRHHRRTRKGIPRMTSPALNYAESRRASATLR